jgi:hypothetical protein
MPACRQLAQTASTNRFISQNLSPPRRRGAHFIRVLFGLVHASVFIQIVSKPNILQIATRHNDVRLLTSWRTKRAGGTRRAAEACWTCPPTYEPMRGNQLRNSNTKIDKVVLYLHWTWRRAESPLPGRSSPDKPTEPHITITPLTSPPDCGRAAITTNPSVELDTALRKLVSSSVPLAVLAHSSLCTPEEVKDDATGIEVDRHSHVHQERL